jgi:membrane-associated phospholipid phosphatase
MANAPKPTLFPRRGWARVNLALRLEDAVAMTFFLLDVAMLAIFGGAGRYEVHPGLGMGILVVTLLLLKELLHQALSTPAYHPVRREDWREFLRPFLRVVRDWFPFLLIPVMYWSLWGDVTHFLVHQDRDAVLIAWDQRLFHCQPSLALQRFVTPSLTAWMEFAYSSHIFLTFLVPCFVYLRRSERDFRQMMIGMVTLSFFGFVGYTLMPAVGPMYALKSQFTVPLYQPYELIQRGKDFMDFARVRRDVFPSMHVAFSFMVWLYAYRNSRRLFWLMSPLVLSLWISTVYLRYHYLVDCVAGFLLVLLCLMLADWLFPRFGSLRFSLRFPATWADWIQMKGFGRNAGARGELGS